METSSTSITNLRRSSLASAEKRANHNATERARRENLNYKFYELAYSIPSLCDTRRPSKSLIVQKSVEYIKSVRARIGNRDKAIADLVNQIIIYRQEINNLRSNLGLKPLSNEEEDALLNVQDILKEQDDAMDAAATRHHHQYQQQQQRPQSPLSTGSVVGNNAPPTPLLTPSMTPFIYQHNFVSSEFQTSAPPPPHQPLSHPIPMRHKLSNVEGGPDYQNMQTYNQNHENNTSISSVAHSAPLFDSFNPGVLGKSITRPQSALPPHLSTTSSNYTPYIPYGAYTALNSTNNNNYNYNNHLLAIPSSDMSHLDGFDARRRASIQSTLSVYTDLYDDEYNNAEDFVHSAHGNNGSKDELVYGSNRDSIHLSPRFNGKYDEYNSRKFNGNDNGENNDGGDGTSDLKYLREMGTRSGLVPDDFLNLTLFK